MPTAAQLRLGPAVGGRAAPEAAVPVQGVFAVAVARDAELVEQHLPGGRVVHHVGVDAVAVVAAFARAIARRQAADGRRVRGGGGAMPHRGVIHGGRRRRGAHGTVIHAGHAGMVHRAVIHGRGLRVGAGGAQCQGKGAGAEQVALRRHRLLHHDRSEHAGLHVIQQVAVVSPVPACIGADAIAQPLRRIEGDRVLAHLEGAVGRLQVAPQPL
ncbi:hypothetical protein G6F23_012737 [Rhizopus arrhizus]|nr:hypothetical protein G6F23_012737 [Rhizopus arrhizus]